MGALLAVVAAVLFGALTVSIAVGLRRAGARSGATVMACVAFAVAAVGALVALAAGTVDDAGGLWRFAVAGIVAPGVSQIVYAWAVRAAGPSRTGILIGASPVVAGLLALWLLDESVTAALAAGTVAIVAGTAALVWEPDRAERRRVVGTLLGLLVAGLFGLSAVALRWASTGSDTSPVAAAGVTLGAGALVALLPTLVARWRPSSGAEPARGHMLEAVRAFAPSGLLLGLAYLAILAAYDRSPVTVVAPLTATESLFAVLFAALLIGVRADAINRRVLLAGGLVVAGGIVVGVAA